MHNTIFYFFLASIILISQLTLIYKLTHNFLVPPSILTTIRLVLRFNNYCFTFSSIHTQLPSSTHLHKSNTDMTSFCAIKTSSAYISHNNEHNSLSLTKFRPLFNTLTSTSFEHHLNYGDMAHPWHTPVSPIFTNSQCQLLSQFTIHTLACFIVTIKKF